MSPSRTHCGHRWYTSRGERPRIDSRRSHTGQPIQRSDTHHIRHRRWRRRDNGYHRTSHRSRGRQGKSRSHTQYRTVGDRHKSCLRTRHRCRNVSHSAGRRRHGIGGVVSQHGKSRSWYSLHRRLDTWVGQSPHIFRCGCCTLLGRPLRRQTRTDDIPRSHTVRRPRPVCHSPDSPLHHTPRKR